MQAPTASLLVELAFVVLPLVVILVVWLLHGKALARTRKGPSSVSVGVGLFLWMWTTAGLGLSGQLARFDRQPPPFALLILATVTMASFFGLSRIGWTVSTLPLSWLVGLHAFRFPLELAMQQAAKEGVMPKQMAFSGWNFDIVTGVTAMLLAIAIAKGRVPRWLIVAWNLMGSLLLLNVVTIALVSTPMVRAFGKAPHQINTFVAFFPYVWLPSILVATALAFHIIVARALLGAGRARLSPKVLIAGGGIGGLTLAALLKRRGRPCLLLERTPHFAPVGAGIILQPNAIKALRIGGIETEVAGRGAAMETMQIRDDGGRVLSRIEAPTFLANFQAGVRGFHRATLHSALLDLIEPSSIRLGAIVRSFGETSTGVFVELETGERIEGSGLVGADGLRSAVRHQTVNDGEPRYSGYTSWRGITDRDSLWPAGQMSESWGCGARFGLVAIDGGRLYWFATANAPAGGREALKADLRSRFARWHHPIPEVIERTADDAILRTDIADRDPIERWGEGRVTLLGDAAHPMTPNLGQGGGQAIEDAVVLDLCLSATDDCAVAFKAYESRRVIRTARVVREARRFGRVGQIENTALRALRNLVVRTTPLSATLGALQWLYDFDA